MDRVKRKSKIQTNGSQPEAHVNEDLMTSSNVTCNISSNQLEISNIREVVDSGIQKRQLVELEGVVETNLEQSYENNHIAKKFKDSNRNNEETDIEPQTVANMTISNNKNDSDISNNKKYVFPNVSYANILKQTSGMRTPSNLPAYVPPQLTSPISQVSESDLYLTQGDQSLLETLETLCGSASTSSKFIDDRIKGNFVSDYVFNLSQKTLSPLEIKVLEKGLGFSPTPSSINEVDLRRDISDFTRKMRCKWFFRNERQENVSETSEFKSKSTWNPPKGAPALELLLSQTEKDILSMSAIVCKMTEVLLLNQQTRGLQW